MTATRLPATGAPSRALPVAEPESVQRESLARDLRSVIKGEVRFSDGDRALYATDSSNYRHTPIGVVLPRSAGDIERAVAVARRHRAPVLARGGGTSLAGQCCNVALVMDCSKYFNHVISIDAQRRQARVEPGTVLDTLRKATRVHGLTFGPDPSTHSRCTLGGMIGNNSCGTHSVMAEFYGPGSRTEDSVVELDVLTYDGLRFTVGPTSDAMYAAILEAGGRRAEIYRRLKALVTRHAGQIRSRFPNIQRRVSGYNLPALLPENGFNIARALCGTEGTCVTILEATVTLINEPRARAVVVLGYPDVESAGHDVPRIREFKPIGLEGMDDILTSHILKKNLNAQYLALLPEGRGWLLAEFGGESAEEACAKAEHLIHETRRHAGGPATRMIAGREEQEEIWKVRESGLGATAFVPGDPDSWEGWEDSAVPVERVGDYLRELRKLLDRHGLQTCLYGHFGQGCIHCRISFDFHTTAGIENYRAFTEAAAHLVVSMGGSLSGEHGDGQSRGELLPIMFGEELVGAFREFKEIWDPEWRMNPGKVVTPESRSGHLRLGPDYQPWEPETHFQFPDDKGSFARATIRCVGVGECRRAEGGTMCPSYMVLREEKHSTRGRAHLLFEMLNGSPLEDGWKNEEVKESLDLCLSCKGCKGDCPVNVDIATYKAEFLSHYYEGRMRPRHAYAFGLIDRWARLAALAPRLVNAAGRTPGLRGIAKAAVGMAPERAFPVFAPRTFRSWFAGRRPSSGGRPVVLWVDTFNDHFHPGTLAAACEVLEQAGYAVTIPTERLCCGRPLYDYGMLDEAARRLRYILGQLAPAIDAGTPVVGLEPSCTAVFRDELRNLLPGEPRAQRLSELTRTLAELLGDNGYEPPLIKRRAIMHGHCHHKAIMRRDADERLCRGLGLEAVELESGCCGMAGSFGFERGKYELSMSVGERKLLPAVRDAEPESLIMADGFSCREQIRQATGRRALHLAEVIQLALHPVDALGPDAEAASLRLAPPELIWRAPGPRRH
ncbi:MAG TPA: FAD-linked oxidase C-terminal domain-containing protein [Gemmatimonadales bacterium]|jgi:FAD/FMN-containing dehydrogenase/Fe-S oxidoreductase